MKRLSLLSLLSILLLGCVGSPVHETVKYNSIQGKIIRNNKGLLNISVGMKRHEIQALIGDPERNEGYHWGSAWLYRTAMTSGVYGTADSDFTPVVFDQNGILLGWGRNFFVDHAQRYEMKIN